MPYGHDVVQRLLAEMVLDGIIHCKVDGPRREVSENRRSEAAIQAAEAVVFEDGPDRA